MELVKIVEALLFAYQEPLSVEHMVRAIRETAKEEFDAAMDDAAAMAVGPLTKVTEGQVEDAIDALNARYAEQAHSFLIAERATGWRLAARPEYSEWCRGLFPGKKTPRLSQAALETLAIIAYRQPITKAAMEAVRGVAVDTMVQQLMERGMVKMVGRAQLPGRPLLYGTTEAFLDHFAIRHLDDLPNALELRRIPLPEAPEKLADAAKKPQANPPEQQMLDLEAAPAEEGEMP
jgi:segregation and condensation protein B